MNATAFPFLPIAIFQVTELSNDGGGQNSI